MRPVALAANQSSLSESGVKRRMDFADATLVVAAEKTGIRSIISIDSDFDIYRLPGKMHIQNVFR
jgi:predicted nucleic acid-binding protein